MSSTTPGPNTLPVSTPATNLPVAIEQAWLKAVTGTHDVLREMPGLIGRDVEGRPLVVALARAPLLMRRYVVVLIDESTTRHLSTGQVRRREVADRVALRLKRPAALAPANLVQRVFKVDARQAQAMTAFAIDLYPPDNPILPESVDLPQQLRPDRYSLEIGVHLNGVFSGTRRDLKSILVAGAPRWGKSTLLQALTYQASAKGWHILLAEPPDGNTFHPPEFWRRVPGVISVAETAVEVLAQLSWLDGEIARRARLFSEVARRNEGIPPVDVEEYNEMCPDQFLPPILLVIDEALTLLDDPEQGDLLAIRLADIFRRTPKWGVLPAIGAHNWQASSVPKKMSANFETRACLHTNDRYVAEAALNVKGGPYLDQVGNFTARGRGLFRSGGEFVEVQCYYVTRDRLKALFQSEAENDLAHQLIEAELDGDGIAAAGQIGDADNDRPVVALPTSMSLSNVEIEIIRYAADNGGKLSHTKLLRAFVDSQKIGEPTLRRILAGWEAQQLVTPKTHTQCRMLKQVLADRAGVTYQEAK